MARVADACARTTDDHAHGSVASGIWKMIIEA
jgi:hypothetical protein